MATVKGVNTTKYDAGPSGDNAITHGLVNAQSEVWTDEYEASAAAAGTVIEMAELPTGAVIHKIELYTDALGGSTTIDVGDSDDTDRYSAAPFDTSTAGVFVSDTPDGALYEIGSNDGDSRLQLLTAGASITGTIKTVVTFSR